MKAFCVLTVASLLLPLSLGARADQMVAANDRVRVEVKVDGNNDRKDLAKTSTDAVTQHKSLEIALSGKARVGADARVVKWTVYAKNLRNNNVKALESGEFKLALDAQGAAKVTTKEVSCTYTPEHSVVEGNGAVGVNPRNGKTGRNQQRMRRVEAEGERYLGYSVKVMDGTQVLGEASDPMGIGDKAPEKK